MNIFKWCTHFSVSFPTWFNWFPVRRSCKRLQKRITSHVSVKTFCTFLSRPLKPHATVALTEFLSSLTYSDRSHIVYKVYRLQVKLPVSSSAMINNVRFVKVFQTSGVSFWGMSDSQLALCHFCICFSWTHYYSDGHRILHRHIRCSIYINKSSFIWGVKATCI